MVEPTTEMTTAMMREAAAPTSPPAPRVDDVMGLEAPALAAGPGLALPDGHRRLERVDAEAGRLERLGPVGGRHADHHRALAHLEHTGAVEQGDAPEGGPADPGLVGHLAQPGHDPALVGLVLEPLDPRTPLGVVAGRAREEDEAAA